MVEAYAADTSRAVDLVERLMEHHTAGRVSPELRALIRENSDIARREVIRYVGYVPRDPAGWLRLQVHRHRYDGGRTCPGFAGL